MPQKTTSINYIKNNIAAADFYFKKDLGQNFITDDNIINKIIKESDITSDDCVLEIGPGMGSLTYFLYQQCKKLVAVEKDDKLYAILKNNFSDADNVTLIHDDILKFNFKQLLELFGTDQKIKAISNLPYSITSAAIMKLLEHNDLFESLTLMMQKEVAQRLAAKPSTKNYGSLTLAVSYYADCTILFNVPSNVFFPKPTVDSSVVLLTLRKHPDVNTQHEKELFEIIRAAFSVRRKTLLNALSNTLGMSKEKIKYALESLQLDPNIRGEALTLEQFAELTNFLYR
jgi:16S rRNA (adenine1518-N6/adenine1519-N6)-dimethyltransferase